MVSASGSPRRVGEVIAGKYRLDAALGAGGTGQVYRGYNVLLGRPVAVKLLLRELAANKEFVARFLREARAMNLVRSPHVVDVLDVGVEPDGTPYIVQELLRGEDLAEHLHRMGGKLPAEMAVELLLPVIDAVAIAHARGVVHRDLKPENIYLADVDGITVPKILDFGISKIVARSNSDEEVTRVGVSMGTPDYMSPEQIQNFSALDVRTDVWALGVVLYEVLAGDLPFKGESAPQKFLAICTRDPVPVEKLNPDVSPELARVVARCLRRKPEERYPTAAEMARDLRAFRDGERLGKTRDIVAPPAFSLDSLEPPPPSPPASPADITIPPTPAEGLNLPDPFEGRVINGRYKIVARVGQQGASKVYRAEQQPLGRPVAVKILRNAQQAAERDPAFKRRFFLEASLCSKLSHPNVITVHDYGRIEGIKEEAYFTVTEWLEGETLAERLKKRGGRLSVNEACNLAQEIARGLREAHKHGVVHRDLEPANVMLVPDEDVGERVKIFNFGLVKFVETKGREDLTQNTTIAGSPEYMAPEQVEGLEVEPRTDLYALGIVFFQCLAGRVPFEGATPMKVILKHATAPVPAMAEYAPGVSVPPAVEHLVRKLLEKSAENRPAGAEEFLRELRAAQGQPESTGKYSPVSPPSAPAPAAPAMVPASSAAPSAPSAPGATTVSAPTPRRSMPVLILLGVVVAVAAAAGGYFIALAH